MPDLNEIIASRKLKKFVKKEYRPWDLSGSHEKPSVAQPSEEPSLQEEAKSTAFSQTNVVNIKNLAESAPLVENISPTEGSNNSSTRVQKSSNKSSLEFDIESIKGQTRAQKSPNSGSLELNKGSNYEQNPLNYYVYSEQNKDLNALKITIARLGGNEKRIFFFIVNICSMRGALSTGEMIASEFDIELNLPRNSRETALKRLVAKELIIREQGKRGKHGTLILSVTQLVRNEALNFLALNQSTDQLKTRVQQGFNSNTYSSNNINITTTEEKNDLPENWLSIDIEPLKQIGFSFTQLQQLYTKGNINPEIVQDSINHFAFGLENNPDTKKYANPLTIIMGVLRKGQAWFEKNYQSPQEIAQRDFIERKKAENERLKALEEEAYKMAFEEWQSTLTPHEIEEIAPEGRKKGDIVPRAVKLSLHFKEYKWPEKKKEFLA